jgi:hypothetical protein
MRKILFVGTLLFNSYAVADIPHVVPTSNCAAGEKCCPAALVCSYEQGCGDLGDWQMGPTYLSNFDGVETFPIFSIQATNIIIPKNYGTITCNYSTSTIQGSITLKAQNSKYLLKGDNWVYGFMNEYADCMTHNPVNSEACPFI